MVNGDPVVNADGQINEAAYNKWIGANPEYNGPDRLRWWNMIGAVLVAIWLGIVFLLILGFGYSYFWSASTIIYLLLRRKVDAAEMDEVYLEEDEGDGAFGGPLTPPAAAAALPVKPGTQSLTMVDAPSLRPDAARCHRRSRRRPPPAPTAPAPTPPPGEDGGLAPRAEVGTAADGTAAVSGLMPARTRRATAFI